MHWSAKLALVTVFSAGTLLGLWFGTEFNMTVSLLAACVVAGLLLWALPRRKEASEIILADGVSQADLDATVEVCRRSGRRFQDLAALIPKPDISEMVAQVGDSCVNIADNFIKDPRDLRQAKDFIYHLGRSVGLVEEYVRMAGQNHLSPDEEAVLGQTEDRIAHIREAFQTHLRNFRADNIRQLAIGGKALGDILRIEAPTGTSTRRT